MNSVHFFLFCFLVMCHMQKVIQEWGKGKRHFRQGRHYIQAEGGVKVGISMSYVAGIKHLTFQRICECYGTRK